MDAPDVQDKPEYAALDVQDKLEYARCAVAILRALTFSDAKMTYKDLARSCPQGGSVVRGQEAIRRPWMRF